MTLRASSCLHHYSHMVSLQPHDDTPGPLAHAHGVYFHATHLPSDDAVLYSPGPGRFVSSHTFVSARETVGWVLPVKVSIIWPVLGSTRRREALCDVLDRPNVDLMVALVPPRVWRVLPMVMPALLSVDRWASCVLPPCGLPDLLLGPCEAMRTPLGCHSRRVTAKAPLSALTSGEGT